MASLASATFCWGLRCDCILFTVKESPGGDVPPQYCMPLFEDGYTPAYSNTFTDPEGVGEVKRSSVSPTPGFGDLSCFKFDGHVPV